MGEREEVGNEIITAAEKLLRKLNDGREPYAASVLPMARALAELAADPAFVLPAAERMLREAIPGDRVPDVFFYGTGEGVEIHGYPTGEDGGVGYEGDTLLAAYEEARRG